MNDSTELIELIPLTPDLPGFDSFINAWLYRGARTYLIDVGPAATVPQLHQALADRGVTRLDGILLTHIHLDHAGGTGHLLHFYPDTPVICHAAAIEHLVAPDKLWQGSLKTLGDTARAYMRPRPVPENLLQPADSFRDAEIVPILTPGHAVHHVSYLAGDHLLAGEAGGVCLQLPSGRLYQRPATPPRFLLDVFTASLDMLITCQPQWIYYGHYGYQPDAITLLQNHRLQLHDWALVLQNLTAKSNLPVRSQQFQEICLNALLQEDIRLHGLDELSPTVRVREMFFLTNSIKGFLG